MFEGVPLDDTSRVVTSGVIHTEFELLAASNVPLYTFILSLQIAQT